MSSASSVVITVPWGVRAGGAETMLWTFLRYVDRERIDPTVVFLQEGPFVREVSELGVHTVTIRAGRLRDARRAAYTVRRLAEVISDNCDVLLNWTAKSHLYGAPAAVVAGMTDRTLWWQHGIPTDDWLDRLATALPARAIGCSSHSSASAQLRLRPRRSTFVVHPGVPAEVADSANGRSGRGRQLTSTADEAVVGIVGRLQPWKGQHRFIRAIAELRRRGYPVRGLVVGGNSHNLSPGYDVALRRLALDSSVAQFVTFTGHVADPARYIRTMDVLVNASRQEPFGIVVLEAMALGVPVVAAAGSGPGEIVESGRSGVLLDSVDETSIANGLELLLSDRRLRRRLGEAGRSHIRAKFSAETMCRRLEAALNGIAAA
jgi:glycosyltransferase involved in cell wall biosynthesis